MCISLYLSPTRTHLSGSILSVDCCLYRVSSFLCVSSLSDRNRAVPRAACHTNVAGTTRPTTTPTPQPPPRPQQQHRPRTYQNPLISVDFSLAAFLRDSILGAVSVCINRMALLAVELIKQYDNTVCVCVWWYFTLMWLSGSSQSSTLGLMCRVALYGGAVVVTPGLRLIGCQI